MMGMMNKEDIDQFYKRVKERLLGFYEMIDGTFLWYFKSEEDERFILERLKDKYES